MSDNSGFNKSAQAACQNSDTLRDELNHLHGTPGTTWRDIARLPQYSGIPAGTLCAIAKTGYIPPKWHKKLGIRKEDRTRFRPDLGPWLGKYATDQAAAQGITLSEYIRRLIVREAAATRSDAPKSR